MKRNVMLLKDFVFSVIMVVCIMGNTAFASVEGMQYDTGDDALNQILCTVRPNGWIARPNGFFDDWGGALASL